MARNCLSHRKKTADFSEELQCDSMVEITSLAVQMNCTNKQKYFLREQKSRQILWEPRKLKVINDASLERISVYP